jgi:HAMP domain-containing protein/preprotein translocase subunit SecG
MISYFQSLSRALGLDERRKATNFLQQPGLQLQLPLFVLLLTGAFLLLVLVLGNLYFEQTFLTMMETTSQTEYLQPVVNEQTREFRNITVLLLAVYAVLVVVVTIAYTHRLIGPMLPVMRHVKALQEGLYEHRVKLRRTDAFQELAAELNELARVLEQRGRRQ